MAAKKEVYISEIIKIIKDKNLMRITHIFPHYKKIAKSRFYQLELEKVEEIKDALENNRVGAVDYMLQRWIKSKNPTLQIAAMRLTCNNEEHKRLNQSYMDGHSDETVKPVEITMKQ